MMPESLNLNFSKSDQTFADPDAAGNVAIVAAHLYGGAPSYAVDVENAGMDADDRAGYVRVELHDSR